MSEVKRITAPFDKSVVKSLKAGDNVLISGTIIAARDAAHKTEYMTDSRFAELKAVKNNRVYVNPKGVFVWCVRSADEVLQPVWAATVIQPDLFSDVDMNKYPYDFYKKYYHYEASDADLQSILFPTE